MSRIVHSLICIAFALALAACGFHPLYGKFGNSSADSTFRSVYIEPIPERVGYELRSKLLDLFNAPNAPAGASYRLKIELKAEEKGLAVQQNAAVTRYTYHLTARFQLVAARSGDVLKKGVVRSLTSYNVVQSPYATVVADKDAQDRAAQDVAERLRTELAVYFLNASEDKS
jgi:LPS-assembly lipoprotein